MKNNKIIIMICMLIIRLQIDATEEYAGRLPQKSAMKNVNSSQLVDDYEKMSSLEKKRYLEDRFHSILEQEENKDEPFNPTKRVRFLDVKNENSQQENTNGQQDFSALNFLVECLEQEENKEEYSDELGQAIQDNLIERRIKFKKSIFVASLFKALKMNDMKLEDFNKLDASKRKKLLIDGQNSIIEEIFLKRYPERIVTGIEQQFNVPHLTIQEQVESQIDPQNTIFQTTSKNVFR